MREINFSVENLINSLLDLSKKEQVCLLDSGGAAHLGAHLIIAGIRPCKILQLSGNPSANLSIFEFEISKYFASIFTIAYKLGMKINEISPRKKDSLSFHEPDIFAAFFDALIIYDYDRKKTFLTGNEQFFDEIENLLLAHSTNSIPEIEFPPTCVKSNFTHSEYLDKIEQIKEFIRAGATYQTNLTQQFSARLPDKLSPQQIFARLRKNHPAPFSAFIKRENDFVISASPERFFQAVIAKKNSTISTSPIKGTRPRGQTEAEDEILRNELLSSAKDRAENIMIVDLLRNDLGRICKFGSVKVEKLCDLEEHPTFFHLVSTVTGELKPDVGISEILTAVFPCGSITGAPKISTMRIIEKLEKIDRGLSMGAIGFSINNSDKDFEIFPPDSLYFDLSVAIRTMVLQENEAVFNVGGGIVIDSDPEAEYEETLTKAKALLSAINGKFDSA